MAVDDDAIGLVRAHRWAKIDVQVQRLKADGCKATLDLGTLKRTELLRLLRDGRVGKLLFAFLLIDPTRKRKLYEDFVAVLAKIEAQGGVIKDVSTGLDSSDKARVTALKDVVRGQIGRHKQGAKSAENGKSHKPGRKKGEFSPTQMTAAKAIWRDLVEYPHWTDAKAALAEIKDARGRAFTTDRARREFKRRKPRR